MSSGPVCPPGGGGKRPRVRLAALPRGLQGAPLPPRPHPLFTSWLRIFKDSRSSWATPLISRDLPGYLFGSDPKRAASLACWPLGHHPVSQSSRVPLSASPTLQLFRLPILKPSADSGARHLQQLSPHSAPDPQRNCSAQHGAQRNLGVGGGTIQNRPFGGGGVAVSSWLVIRMHSGENPGPGAVESDVTNLECTVVGYKIWHLFITERRGDTSHLTPPPSFSSIQQCFSSFGKG